MDNMAVGSNSEEGDVTRFLGSVETFHHLSSVADFEVWVQEEHGITNAETLLPGYRLLVRTAFLTLANSMLHHTPALGIEKDFTFNKACAELGDIERVQSTCQAAALSRKVSQYNREIHLSSTVSDVVETINEISEEFVQPFLGLAERVEPATDELSASTAYDLATALQTFTFLTDVEHDIPWGIYVSEFEFHLSNESALSQAFIGYRYGLEYLWQNIADSLDRDVKCINELHNAESWKEMRQLLFGPLKEQLFEISEGEYGIRFGDPILLLTEPIPEKTLEHLFVDKQPFVIGKKERLRQLLLWEHAERLDQNSLDKGAFFLSLLRGMSDIRGDIDPDLPIFVRRFVHPDPTADGNNYSYAVRLDAPHIAGSSGMRGWMTFVRAGTDYSGYGTSQYRAIESEIERLVNDGIAEIEGMRIDEDEFKELLKKNHSSSDPVAGDRPIRREPTYRGMTFAEILNRGETDTVEYKAKISNTDKIAKEIAALANTNGGVLVLGVNDDGKIVGIEDPEQDQLRITGLLRSEKFLPRLKPEFSVRDENGKDILLVEISKLDSPCAVNYRYYARIGTSAERQTYEELKERFE